MRCPSLAAALLAPLIVMMTAILGWTPAAADPPLPMMDPDRPVQCARDTSGQEWRIQCDETTRRCLYASNQELDTRGNPTKPLERARRCEVGSAPFRREDWQARGYTMVPGRPDAPYGWMRDDRGRVFQVNFDLTRRMYIGGGWAPQARLDQPLDRSRSSIDFGLFIFETTRGRKNPTRHRIRAVEGDVHLAPFSAQVVLLHYDMSHRFLDPLLRVTTFFGRPKRYDLALDIGMWTEAGAAEFHHAAAGDSTLWKFGVGQITLDLWQSALLDSFVRVRTGMGVERLYTDTIGDRSALTASSALEGRFVLDDSGLHNLSVELSHEVPRYFIPHPDTGRLAERTRARAEYEVIALAINDQPLSLTIGAGADRRDDLPGATGKWALVGDLGARFSLWAPPRQRR